MEQDGTLDPDWRSRVIEVMNKADLMGGVAEVPVRPGAVAVSAITGEGLGALMRAIDQQIARGHGNRRLRHRTVGRRAARLAV